MAVNKKKEGRNMDKDMIDYLESILEKQDTSFDWEINWNKRQHVIEVFVTIYAEADSETVIQDAEGTVNNEEGIQFEDVVCFYDPNKSKIITEDYLHAFPFSIKKGLEKGFLDAVIKVLRIVVGEGQTNLEEFVRNPEIETFELVWNEGNFNQTIETLKNTDRYDSTLIPYPKF